MGVSQSKEPVWEMVTPAPQQGTQQQRSRGHGQAPNRLAPPAEFPREKKVIIVVNSSSREEPHEYHFNRSEICAFSVAINHICMRSPGDVTYALTEEQPGLFVYYKQWVHNGQLPIPKQRAGERLDTLQFYISLHRLGNHMMDARLVSYCRDEFISLAQIGMMDYYAPSIRSYVKYNRDVLRNLFLDLLVADFDIATFAWKGLSSLPMGFMKDVIKRTGEEKSKEKAKAKLKNTCRYHHHDALFPISECKHRARGAKDVNVIRRSASNLAKLLRPSRSDE